MNLIWIQICLNRSRQVCFLRHFRHGKIDIIHIWDAKPNEVTVTTRIIACLVDAHLPGLLHPKSYFCSAIIGKTCAYCKPIIRRYLWFSSSIHLWCFWEGAEPLYMCKHAYNMYVDFKKMHTSKGRHSRTYIH